MLDIQSLVLIFLIFMIVFSFMDVDTYYKSMAVIFFFVLLFIFWFINTNFK